MLEQVDHWQEYLALVNMILFCTGVPGHYPVSETTSSLTLTFWYTLQVRSGLIFWCLGGYITTSLIKKSFFSLLLTVGYSFNF